jgi:UDP-GlcNAc:undecaprenyl-phosphate GlcNAc-1-phosphate transferase
VLGVKLRFDEPPNVTWMIPILVLGLPIFDMGLVTFTRLREGRSPFQGSSKDHTSHRLIRWGLGQRGTLAVLYGVCAVLGVAAVVVSRAPSVGWTIGALAAVSGVAAFVFLEWLYARNKD